MVSLSKTDELCINTIRALAMDAVQKAGNGHPGTAMGAATMAYALWARVLRHSPTNPDWPNRDRFVLSAGHASVLLYSLLHLTGYELSLDEIKAFRKWDSKTPGHPEYHLTPGVEATTGPLGQGFAMGVGMALAERFLAERFNRPGHQIVDHYVYGIVSDGDLMEGVAHEAASLAGTLGLGKLIYLYDDNSITIEGSTDLAFTENVGDRFQALGWHVQRVDGNDLDAVIAALEEAKAETSQPSLIAAKTTIAFGSPNKAGTAEAHGAALGEAEVLLTKEALGWPTEPPFLVPEETLAEMRSAIDHGKERERDWQERVAAYAEAYPEDANLFQEVLRGELPADWDAGLPAFTEKDGPIATRVASGKVLNAAVQRLPTLLGGSADLAPSTMTDLTGLGDINAGTWGVRNLHFGVREHAMGAIVNGMSLHGGVIPFGATFFIFTDYMRPAIRLAALMNIQSMFVLTHDSIGLGEDGPTHQPVEHLASLRAMPNLTVFRPADANETTAAWRLMIKRRGPSLLVLTRQNLPIIEDAPRVQVGVERGAYIVEEAASGKPDVILIATGSEVALALRSRELLTNQGLDARVVSMPSWEVFEEQPQEYKNQVLPSAIAARVSIEAGSTLGWERYVGEGGGMIGLDHFGASAPGGVLFERFGFTPDRVVERAQAVAKQAQERG